MPYTRLTSLRRTPVPNRPTPTPSRCTDTVIPLPGRSGSKAQPRRWTVSPKTERTSRLPTGLRPPTHGAECVAVRLSVALELVQVPPNCCHGGVQETILHTTGPVCDAGICRLHWP